MRESRFIFFQREGRRVREIFECAGGRQFYYIHFLKIWIFKLKQRFMYVICMKARPAYAGLEGDEDPDSPLRFEHAGIIYIYI